MRRCELAGASLDGLDLAAGTLTIDTTRVVVDGRIIESDGKTENAQRTLALDPFTLAALKAHVEQLGQERQELGPDYQDHRLLFSLWVLILVLGLRKGEALELIDPDDGWRTDEDSAVIDLEWQLQRVGGHPLTHKQVLKADGSTDTLPLPPICVTALRIAKRNQDQARTVGWPDTCICGEKHALVFSTRTGHPIEPRINRAFDVRCARYGVRRITLHDTRRTCGSLLAALDVHPRIAMAILRHSRIALTMEIYTQVPDIRRPGTHYDG